MNLRNPSRQLSDTKTFFGIQGGMDNFHCAGSPKSNPEPKVNISSALDKLKIEGDNVNISSAQSAQIKKDKRKKIILWSGIGVGVIAIGIITLLIIKQLKPSE